MNPAAIPLPGSPSIRGSGKTAAECKRMLSRTRGKAWQSNKAGQQNRYFIKSTEPLFHFMPLSLTTEQKQAWLWVTLAILLVALLVLLGPVLTPFITAGILAYALNPGVDWLASHRLGRLRLPRAIAVMIMMALLFAFCLMLILIVVPVLEKEIPLLQQQIPVFLSSLNDLIGPRLQALGITTRLDVDGIKGLLSERVAAAGSGIWSSVLSSARIGGIALLGWMVTLFLIPVALFYLLLDWHPMLAKLEASVPRRWAGRVVRLAHEVDSLLAQYLRGQLLVMLVLALYYSVALGLAGLEVALPVGIITGLLVFIPYVGFGLGMILALVAAVLQFDSLQGVLIVAGIYGAGQVIEGFFLTPRLVGERIGLHPLTVIFALLAFGQLFGFVGVLLALPASAVISVALRHMRNNYLNSSFYTQP
jgi:predicted PurR-regulated permease PerM